MKTYLSSKTIFIATAIIVLYSTLLYSCTKPAPPKVVTNNVTTDTYSYISRSNKIGDCPIKNIAQFDSLVADSVPPLRYLSQAAITELRDSMVFGEGMAIGGRFYKAFSELSAANRIHLLQILFAINPVIVGGSPGDSIYYDPNLPKCEITLNYKPIYNATTHVWDCPYFPNDGCCKNVLVVHSDCIGQ
jgi:hypothetical protein